MRDPMTAADIGIVVTWSADRCGYARCTVCGLRPEDVELLIGERVPLPTYGIIIADA